MALIYGKHSLIGFRVAAGAVGKEAGGSMKIIQSARSGSKIFKSWK
jgi:hypothetical protein